jgi:hypothetical protein
MGGDPVTIAFARAYRLVPRGAAGLACDDDGVALGAVTLVEAAIDPSGRRFYRIRPGAEVAQALRLAYGYAPDKIELCRRGLADIAQLLTAGEQARACIRAVQFACPEVLPDAMAKLAQAALLQKDNANWADEPRIPAGSPDGGEWTNDGAAAAGTEASIRPAADGSGNGPTGNPDIRPIAAPLNPVQTKKERFVDAHLADTQKAAGQLGVPVENILGVALESNWGASRIAIQGHNFYGINYPCDRTNPGKENGNVT